MYTHTITRTHAVISIGVSGEGGGEVFVVGVGTEVPPSAPSETALLIRNCYGKVTVAISRCVVRDNVLVASNHATVLITCVLLYWREWRNIYMPYWHGVTKKLHIARGGSENFSRALANVSRPPLYQNPPSPAPLCAVHRVVRAASGAVRGALEWSASQLRSVAGGESRSERGLVPCVGECESYLGLSRHHPHGTEPVSALSRGEELRWS